MSIVHKHKYWVSSLIGLFLLAISASAWSQVISKPQSYKFISLKKLFVDWHAKTNMLSVTEGITAFQTMIIAAHQDVYNSLILEGMTKPNQDWFIENAVSNYRKNFEENVEAFNYLETQIPALVDQFVTNFDDIKLDALLVAMPSLGVFNGKEGVMGNTPLVGFGVEFLLKTDHRDRELPVILSHELFHLYHFKKAGFWETTDEPLKLWLWIDGLATYASKAFLPKATSEEILMDAILAKYYSGDIEKFLSQLKPALDSHSREDQKLWFAMGQEPNPIPQRMGYCIGLRIVERLAQKYSLKEMASWSKEKAGKAVSDTIEEMLLK